jgi:hypothetical protein
MPTSANKSACAAIFVFGAMMAGCAQPDLYLDRRDSIAFHAGDAVRSNIVAQTIDPWPRHAAKREIAHDGDRMQAAGERYRTGKIIEPKGLATSSVEFNEAQGGSADSGSKK